MSQIYDNMKKIIFLLLLIPIVVSGQTKSDEIYSLLINKKIIDWGMNKDSISKIIITNSLTKFSINKQFDLTEIIDSISNGSNFPKIHYYKHFIDLKSNNDFKKLLNDFKTNIYKKTSLNQKCFKLGIPVKIINKNSIEKIFSSKIVKGWNNFYKMYPKTTGYFEFSNIEIYNEFAIVYFIHRANPLTGFGRFEILVRENGKWNKLAYINVWNN